jgi:hypothetical protein
MVEARMRTLIYLNETLQENRQLLMKLEESNLKWFGDSAKRRVAKFEKLVVDSGLAESFSFLPTANMGLESLIYFVIMITAVFLSTCISRMVNKMCAYMYAVACVEFLWEVSLHYMVAYAGLTNVQRVQSISASRYLVGGLEGCACFAGLILSLFVTPHNEGDAGNKAIDKSMERIAEMQALANKRQTNENLARQRQAPVQTTLTMQPMDQNLEQPGLQMIALANQVGRQPIDQNLEQEEQNGSHDPEINSMGPNAESESVAKGPSASNDSSSRVSSQCVKPKDTKDKPPKRKNEDDARASSDSKRRTSSRNINTNPKSTKHDGVATEGNKCKTDSDQGPSSKRRQIK